MADYNINAATRRVVLSGSAGTGPYSFTFAVLVQTDLAVYLNSTKLTLTTDYTVSIAANGTGTVTLNTGTTNVPTTPTSSDSIIIVGARALERTTDFVTAGDLRASALNEQLDANVIFDQQLAEENQRTVKAPVFDPATTEGGGTVDMTLPAKDTRKGKYLAFNETTGNPEAGPSVSDVTTVSAAATDIALLADIQDGTTATNAITTVASNDANIATVAGNSANVTTVAGISSDVTVVAGKASLITSDFVADLNTLGTAAVVEDLNILGTADVVSDLDTAATNISAIQGASANAATASTKASEASASATAAANSAAALAAALDGFDDKYLGTMADTDTASSASTTATWVVGGSTLTVASASGIEIGQNVSATGIPNQANVLAIDGTSVTISHVATAAGTGAAVTFQGYGVYGAFNSSIDGPSKDNDNGTLSSGMLYFNSTDNEMRVYDGANWIAATSAGDVSLILYEYTATAGQTTFSGSDDNGASLSYTVDNLQVVMNGVVLDPADFTATNGTSVVLDSGATVGDQVNIYSFKSFTTADMVSKTAGGTFSGAVGFSGGITGDVSFDTNTLHVDSTNNRIGVGTLTPENPIEIETANTLGSTFTGTTHGEGLRVTQSSYSSGNFVSLVEAPYQPNGVANVRIAAMFDGTGSKLSFGTSNSYGSGITNEAMRIDSSGNVGIGTTSPSQIGSRTTMDISSADGAGIRLSDGSNSMLIDYNDSIGGRVRVNSTDNLEFGNAGVTRMQLHSGGGIYQYRGNAYHGREGSGGSFTSGERSHVIYAGGSTHYLQLSARNVADASPSLLVVVGGTTRAEIECNGDYLSATNSYGSTSDETLKENIVASGSQWDDIKAVQVKKFSYIEDDLDAPNLLGVIAQDLEASGMSGLVKTKTKTSQTEDGDEEVVLDDDGNPVTYKTVKYSILYMKAVKALQEAMERIETLETKVAALEAE